ncbi:hypothetical protein Leryth_022782 [Lithospermum erythrorhizon]|nr:hypothetical protein Leryth_022782 [Lithospermum erythrorhizon]
MSESQLVTIKDLLRFMLTIQSRPPMQQINKAPPLSRDSTKVIVNALKENPAHGGMTRQDLRDAARLHIGDRGLMDHVLKEMNNVIVGKNVVRRTVNPVTRILEYSIREGGNEANLSQPKRSTSKASYSIISGARGSHLATQPILESKHLAKEWPFGDAEDQYLRLCGTEAEMEMVLPVGQIIVVPMHPTVGELKQAVENVLKDTYCITDEFVLMEIVELEEWLFRAVESGAELCVRGTDSFKNRMSEG